MKAEPLAGQATDGGGDGREGARRSPHQQACRPAVSKKNASGTAILSCSPYSPPPPPRQGYQFHYCNQELEQYYFLTVLRDVTWSESSLQSDANLPKTDPLARDTGHTEQSSLHSSPQTYYTSVLGCWWRGILTLKNIFYSTFHTGQHTPCQGGSLNTGTQLGGEP